MNKLSFVFFLIISSVSVTAQNPIVDSTYFFGGATTGSFDISYARAVQKTMDGGYIIAGATSVPHVQAVNYHGSMDGFVVKLNSALELEWSRCYGSNLSEDIVDIKQDNVGNYILAGNSGANFYVVKTDNNGNVIWETIYGNPVGPEICKSIDILSDGSIIVAGTNTEYDAPLNGTTNTYNISVIKINPQTGAVVNQYIYGGSRHDYGNSIVASNNGGFFVAGQTFSSSGDVTCRSYAYCESDFFLISADSNGNIIDSDCFAVTSNFANNFNLVNKIINTSDGGQLLLGKGRGNGNTGAVGQQDFRAIKIDANGLVQWEKHYGGYENDEGISAKQTSDGGYILVGKTSSNSGQISNPSSYYVSQDGWIVKISATGVLEWNRKIGGGSIDEFFDVEEMSPNEFIVVGETRSTNFDCATSGGRRFWVSKISNSLLSTSDQNSNTNFIYPNPANNILYLSESFHVTEVFISDMSGRKLIYKKAEGITQVDVSAMTTGIYLVTVRSAGKYISQKIIKN